MATKATKVTKATKAANATKRKQVSPSYGVRRSPIHGRGVFARHPIRKGETVIEYKGEIIDEAEIDRRYPENLQGLNHTFVFGIEHDYNIDGGAKGNAARWINHSCQPNCDTYERDKRIFIRAARAIRAGEELSYDYAIAAGEPLTPALKARWPCWCGAKNCRGTVLVPSRKPPKRKKTKRGE